MYKWIFILSIIIIRNCNVFYYVCIVNKYLIWGFFFKFLLVRSEILVVYKVFLIFIVLYNGNI